MDTQYQNNIQARANSAYGFARARFGKALAILACSLVALNGDASGSKRSNAKHGPEPKAPPPVEKKINVNPVGDAATRATSNALIAGAAAGVGAIVTGAAVPLGVVVGTVAAATAVTTFVGELADKGIEAYKDLNAMQKEQREKASERLNTEAPAKTAVANDAPSTIKEVKSKGDVHSKPKDSTVRPSTGSRETPNLGSREKTGVAASKPAKESGSSSSQSKPCEDALKAKDTKSTTEKRDAAANTSKRESGNAGTKTSPREVKSSTTSKPGNSSGRDDRAPSSSDRGGKESSSRGGSGGSSSAGSSHFDRPSLGDKY